MRIFDDENVTEYADEIFEHMKKLEMNIST